MHSLDHGHRRAHRHDGREALKRKKAERVPPLLNLRSLFGANAKRSVNVIFEACDFVERLKLCEACGLDLTNALAREVHDLADFFEFFGCYDLEDPCGDVNFDGSVDLADFFDFFGSYDTCQ